MIRVSRYVFRTRSTLLLRHPVEVCVLRHSKSTGQPIRIKLRTEPARETCPPKPDPPCPPPKNDKWLWLSVAGMVIAGSFTYYAKEHPELRDWLTIYAPWFDDFVAIVYQENMSYMDFLHSTIEDIKKHIEDYRYPPPKPEECLLPGETNPPPRPPVVEPPPPPPKPKDPNDPCLLDKGEEEDPKCPHVPIPIVTKDLCELETCMLDLAETVINNYYTAREICRYYCEVVGETMNNDFCPRMALKLEPEMKERICLVKASLDEVEHAKKDFADLATYIECGCQLKKEDLQATKDFIQELKDKMYIAKVEYLWENDRAHAEDAHWKSVMSFMEKYTDEIKSMFPEVDYTQKHPYISGNIDTLLVHNKRYLEKLIDETLEKQAEMSVRVNRAVKQLDMKESDKKSQIDAAYNKKKSALAKDTEKKFNDKKCQREKEMQQALKETKESYEKQTEKRLAEREKEAQDKLDEMVKQKVAIEKAKFQEQLNDMRAKLDIVEKKLQDRIKTENEAKRSQALWAAGNALMQATKSTPRSSGYVNVSKELKAIEENGGGKDGDKMVKTVLAAIPESVYVRGVLSETMLKEKYYRMQDVARKVALVENEGGPMPIYILSYLQDLLLFLRPSTIPQKEKEHPPKEVPEGLDTFDLLQRATYYMEHDNLASAMKYVDKMEGASRGAAEAWHSDARAFLETRQAAAALMAHAAALATKFI